MKKSGFLIRAIEEKCVALEFDINSGTGFDAAIARVKMALAKDALSIAQEPSEGKVKDILISLGKHPDDPDFQYFKRTFEHLALSLKLKAEILDVSSQLSRMEHGLLAATTRFINNGLIVIFFALMIVINMSSISLTDSFQPSWQGYLLLGGHVVPMMLISRIFCRLAFDWGLRRNGVVTLISGRLFGNESRTSWKGACFSIGLTVLLLLILLVGLYLVASMVVVQEPYALILPALYAALSLVDSYREKKQDPLEEHLVELRGKYDASRRLVDGN